MHSCFDLLCAVRNFFKGGGGDRVKVKVSKNKGPRPAGWLM